MKSKIAKIISAASAAALVLCLAGCSGNTSGNGDSASDTEATRQEQQAATDPGAIEPYIEVDRQTFSSDEWGKKVSGNSLAAESYVGKQVTIVAPVLTVFSNGSLIYGDMGLYECPIGEIVLRFGINSFDVDIPEQYKDVVANISTDVIDGDYVKVTGTITKFIGSTAELINGPVDDIPNSGPITIEKLS